MQKVFNIWKNVSCDDFRTETHKPQWVVNTRQKIIAGVNILSQIKEHNYKEASIKTIYNIINHITSAPGKGLKYKQLGPESLLITVLSEGSFRGNDVRSSQVGYIIFLTDKYKNANVIVYRRIKSRHVLTSVLGAETFALVDALDVAILVQHDLRSILKIPLKIIVLTDSAILFNLMIRNTITA